MPLVDLPREPKILQNLVGGAWSRPEGAPLLDVTSPYTSGVIGKVPMSSADEVARVVAAAKAAQPQWQGVPIKERSQFLFQYRQLLLSRIDEVAHSAAGEAGKTVAEARAGVLKGVEVVEFALSIQNLDTGGSMEVSRGVTCEYRREPLGVVAGITPFNFPAMVPMWMFPIAITLGNAFILKPSEKVPLTANLLGQIMMDAGFPAGIFSIVHGGKEAVEALITHKDVAAIAFVGSTPIARKLYELGTANGKRVLALGGAKNHLIVVPDADEAVTVQGVVDSFTGCAGQRCMAASVLVAVGDVDRLLTRVIEKAASIAVGEGMGAIIDKGSLERIESAIAKAEKDGAKVVVDGRGKHPASAEYAQGSWIGPTVIDKVTPDMDIRHTEVFGPVLTIVHVPTLKDAIALQHQSQFGNAASVFTTNGAVAQYVAENAHAGMIGVNVGVPVPREPFSFGGTQDSKFGQGDITGHSGIDFWTHTKKITRKWAAQVDATWMG